MAVSLERYLQTSYSPDREYVDGAVVSRNVGKRPHSLVLSNLTYFLQERRPDQHVLPTLRICTVAGKRCRVPDICVYDEDPLMDVPDTPPLLCVEILSPEDRAADLLEKLEEYRAFGVPHIWIIDPRRKKAFTFGGGLQEVKGGDLTAGDFSLPLAEVFQGL